MSIVVRLELGSSTALPLGASSLLRKQALTLSRSFWALQVRAATGKRNRVRGGSVASPLSPVTFMALREGGESTADVNTSLDRFRFRRSLGLLAIGDGGGALEPGAAAATARLFLLLLFVVAAEWTSFLGDVGGVATAASSRILSSGALSRPVGAPLQHRW